MSKCDPRTISVLSSSCSPCWYIWWFSVVLSSCSRSLHWSWSLTKPCNNQLLAPREATAPHDHSTSSWLIPLSIPVSKTPSWSLSHRRPDMSWRLSVSGTGLCGDEVLWEINQGLRLIPHSTLSPPPHLDYSCCLLTTFHIQHHSSLRTQKLTHHRWWE